MQVEVSLVISLSNLQSQPLISRLKFNYSLNRFIYVGAESVQRLKPRLLAAVKVKKNDKTAEHYRFKGMCCAQSCCMCFTWNQYLKQSFQPSPLSLTDHFKGGLACCYVPLQQSPSSRIFLYVSRYECSF